MREVKEITLCSWCGEPTEKPINYRGELICPKCNDFGFNKRLKTRKFWKGVKRGKLGKII